MFHNELILTAYEVARATSPNTNSTLSIVMLSVTKQMLKLWIETTFKANQFIATHKE